jgi:predicted O-linked N-acetylglucosamine transferase (SPINDLY family)
MEWRNAHRVIAETEMDVLFYTDIGMEPYTYFLAYARLAPVQCTTWGHPVTSGIRNIDYYLSCEDFEPPDAEQHYSEKLVRLGSPPTYYERPQLPRNAKARADYPWDADKHLYFCPQTLFKFHPDFDEALGNILRRDQDGQVVLINSRHQHWLDLLLARFHRSIPDVVDRIVVLPFQSPEDYLNLLHKCDVILDTFHFVGGSSSLQALGLGTPIVTLPGQYQRGRFTFSYYKMMKYLECVANDPEDYVRIAVRLGTDPEYRRQVSEQIAARNNILYENISVVQEIEQFLVNVVRPSDE